MTDIHTSRARDHAPTFRSTPNNGSSNSSQPTSSIGRASQSRCHNDQSSLIMISTVPLNAGRRRVFGSVFSPASLEARPPFASSFNHDHTPFASFQSSDSSSTIKTGSQATAFSPVPQEPPADREAWDRAWSAATAFLSVPNRGFAPIYESRETDGSEALKDWNRLSPPSKETGEALAYLTAAAQNTRDSPGATRPKDLFSWYGDEIRRHFLTNLRGGLFEVWTQVPFACRFGTDLVTAFAKSRERRPFANNCRLLTTRASNLPSAYRTLPTTVTTDIRAGASVDTVTTTLSHGCLVFSSLVRDLYPSGRRFRTKVSGYLGNRYSA